MIFNQRYKRLMRVYMKTGHITDSAMEADVDRHMAHKYFEGGGKCPAQLQARHTSRMRSDPLERVSRFRGEF